MMVDKRFPEAQRNTKAHCGPIPKTNPRAAD